MVSCVLIDDYSRCKVKMLYSSSIPSVTVREYIFERYLGRSQETQSPFYLFASCYQDSVKAAHLSHQQLLKAPKRSVFPSA